MKTTRGSDLDAAMAREQARLRDLDADDARAATSRALLRMMRRARVGHGQRQQLNLFYDRRRRKVVI